MCRAGSDRCTSDNGARLERRKKSTCFYIRDFLRATVLEKGLYSAVL